MSETEKVAHNMTIASVFNPEQGRWIHLLSTVISDVDKEKQEAQNSQQFNMTLEPAIPANVMVKALRDYADHIDAYLAGNPLPNTPMPEGTSPAAMNEEVPADTEAVQ